MAHDTSNTPHEHLVIEPVEHYITDTIEKLLEYRAQFTNPEDVPEALQNEISSRIKKFIIDSLYYIKEKHGKREVKLETVNLPEGYSRFNEIPGAYKEDIIEDIQRIVSGGKNSVTPGDISKTLDMMVNQNELNVTRIREIIPVYSLSAEANRFLP